MDINEFWKLIGVIDQDALEEWDDEEVVEPLAELLASKNEEYVGEFQEHLSQALYAIDGQ